MIRKKLSDTFTPKIVTVAFPFDESLIQSVEQELSARASQDTDKCFGYFPGMKGRQDIAFDLPISQQFAEQAKTLDVTGKKLYFNFLRLSLVDQPTISPFHLDSDSATALTGDEATMAQRLVWRLLVNMSDTKSRTVVYLNLDPSSIKLTTYKGYISYPSKSITDDMIKSVKLPPRDKNTVSAVLFCASRVLHAGKDMDSGHFVAGYGVDEDDPSGTTK